MKLRYRVLLFIAVSFWIVLLLYRVIPLPVPALLYLPLENSFNSVCHREATKTIYISGQPLAVCARCTGIYTGAWLVSAAVMVAGITGRNPNRLFAAAVLLLLTDVILHNLGVYDYSKNAAFGTGLFFGSVTFLYFYKALKNFSDEKRELKKIE